MRAFLERLEMGIYSFLEPVRDSLKKYYQRRLVLDELGVASLNSEVRASLHTKVNFIEKLEEEE